MNLYLKPIKVKVFTAQVYTWKMKLLGQAIQNISLELKKYENMFQGHMLKSNVTNFERLHAGKHLKTLSGKPIFPSLPRR